MNESPCCSPETITTVLINFTPTQNEKFKIFLIKKKPWLIKLKALKLETSLLTAWKARNSKMPSHCNEMTRS